ncbi:MULTISPECIES: HAMP domain-containing sensor histidine kinase [Cetobacterium]|uniref:histidine kinase n=1 Tax=Candidatus Cetobacterium colombiensis TaxID=3073100 RepID=A0ABU4WBL8_9FUSO|nr:HAMP domain-containing sensor histidine kinase [Candidatus Cetobacterium colombiensis]MDX8336929.1 HAMP domain-containing sensor histidine kinase [Candidatus Cetobacterium colombiensis]
MMKIKFNFFKKLMVYSVFIAFISVAIVQILNLISLDYFYIYRKKLELPLIAKKIEQLTKNENELNSYIDDIKSDGIQINYGNMNMGYKGKNIGKRNNFLNQNNLSLNTVSLIKTKMGGRHLVYYKFINNQPLILTLPLVTLQNYQYEAILIQIISMFIAIFISLILGRYFSKKLTKNLEKLNVAAHKIADLKFVEKLDINTKDEIGELASSIEKMSLELNKAMSSLKSFVGNASHELKTPVATINMISQNLRDNKNLNQNDRKKLYDSLVTESNEMNELIQKLLILSKITYSKNHLNYEEFNLKGIIQKTLYKYELIELEKNIDVEISGDPKLSIKTDYNFFKIVMENLIQNALKYSLENETINIEYNNNSIILKNKTYFNLNGNISELFFPFKRGDSFIKKEIDGSGLGLYIVKNILELLNLKYEINIRDNYFYFMIYLN